MNDELPPRARRFGLLVTALAPVIPQVLGSAFNIWYNAIIIAPLLVTEELRHRFRRHRYFLQCRSLSGSGRDLDLCDPFPGMPVFQFHLFLRVNFLVFYCDTRMLIPILENRNLPG